MVIDNARIHCPTVHLRQRCLMRYSGCASCELAAESACADGQPECGRHELNSRWLSR